MRICVDHQMYSFPEGTSLYEIAKQAEGSYPWPIILAVEGGRLTELSKPAHGGEEISFVTVHDRIGFETMRRSYTMLFLTALQHVLRKSGEKAVRCRLHFSLGDAFFFTIDDSPVTEELLGKIDAEMRRLARAAVPFKKESLGTEDARRLFAERGMTASMSIRWTIIRIIITGSWRTTRRCSLISVCIHMRTGCSCSFRSGRIL